MRKVYALALVLALQAAALVAPLVHAHVDTVESDHHRARTIHSHWEGHGQAHRQQSRAQTIEPDEYHDRAFFLDAFTAVTPEPLFAPALAVSQFLFPPSAEVAAHRVVDITHSHDPPFLPSLAARAPPAV